MIRVLKYTCLVLLSLWILYLFLYNLHVLPLENWDEAFYADTIRRMARTHNFLIPYWDTVPSNDKPPLYFWLSLPFVYIFGYYETSYRIVSILSTLCILVLVFRHEEKREGFLPAFGAIIWLISNLLFIYRNRAANLDSLATLFVLLSYLSLNSRHKYRYFGWGLSVGLLYLTKASLAYYLFPVVILYSLLELHLNLKQKLWRMTQAFVTYAATISVWLVPLILFSGFSTAVYYVLQSDQGTANLSISNVAGVYWRFLVLASSRWLTGLSILGFLCLIKYPKKNFLLLYYAWSLMILLNLSPVKNNWYLMPILPFWALAAGSGVNFIIDFFSRDITKKWVKHIIIVVIFLLGIFQHYRVYQRALKKIIQPDRDTHQVDVALYAKNYVEPKTIVIRLDNYYPLAVYYTDQKVFSSPNGQTTNDALFMARQRLYSIMKSKQKVMLLGQKDSILEVAKLIDPVHIVYESGDQAVAVNYEYNPQRRNPPKPSTTK